VPARPLRILAAEDNRVNRLLLGAILDRAGHKTVFAENGRQALEIWARGGFDLILMDLQMPEMGGLDVARAIRGREAATGDRIPILAVTARAMQEDQQMTMEAGMDGYIAKPYTAAEVLAEVNRLGASQDAVRAA
jgi:CheY-like chemotaxis protein